MSVMIISFPLFNENAIILVRKTHKCMTRQGDEQIEAV